jgi:hypothetical protein
VKSNWLNFALSVAASIVAAVIFLFLSQIFSKGSRHPYLDVAIEPERYGSLVIYHVRCANRSSYAFDKLKFIGAASGNILRSGVAAPGVRRMLSRARQAPLWTGSLGTGEQIEFVVIVESGELSRDLQAQFSGTYQTFGKRGFVERRPVLVRAEADAQLARYLLVGRIAGAGVVAFLVITVVWYIRRRIHQRKGAANPADRADV